MPQQDSPSTPPVADAAEELTIEAFAEQLKGFDFEDSPEGEPSPEPTRRKTPPPAGDDASSQDDEGADAGDDSGSPPAPSESLHPVTIDGKTEMIPLSELLKGYSRTGDYTRKTQAVAAERKKLEDERSSFDSERTATRAERERYAEMIPLLETQLEDRLAQYARIDWDALRAQDPAQFATLRAQYSLEAERAAAVTEERERLDREAASEREAKFKAFQRRQQDLLIEREPTLVDLPSRKAYIDKAFKWAKDTLKASDEEVNSIQDHRVLIAFHKAALYDESQATLAEARTKVRDGARATPGSESDEGDRRKSEPRSVQARRRLAQTGSVEDAARVIELEMIEEREEREGGRKPRRNE